MKSLVVIMVVVLSGFALRAQENLLKNPGFETLDPSKAGGVTDWVPFSEKGGPPLVVAASEGPQEGASAMKVAFAAPAEKFYGVTQVAPVKAGQAVKFGAQVKNLTLSGDSYAQISLEWLGGPADQKKEVSRNWGPKIDAATASTAGWKKLEMMAPVPEGATDVVAVVTLFPGTSPAGAILVDAASLTTLAK